jgi:hypothetical protein
MRRAAHGTRSRASGSANDRGGFALMVVLLVLLALLVLCTPFLISARNADRASSQISDRTQSRVALDTAARHARAGLYATHSSLDGTPYFDTLDEIEIKNQFPAEFLDARDEHGVMWDLEVTDAAGQIDLNSAGPHVLANLMDASTRFSAVVDLNSKELTVASTVGFEPTGFLWVGGELIHYTRIVENTFADFQRGMLGPANETEWFGGPRPPSLHDAGAPVLDQRAFALCAWRLHGPDSRLRTLSAVEELADAGSHVLARMTGGDAAAPVWNADVLRPLVAHGTVHGGLRAGPMWQHAARLTSPVQGGKDGKITVDCSRWMNPGTTIEISDGTTVEMAIVQVPPRGNEVTLDKVLANDYLANRAQVRVLARRPVNLNTARVEVLRALFTNLQLVGKNARITRDEARTLADLVMESRPFTGFEDFLRRIVLPAAGLEKLPSDAPVVPDMLVAGGGFLDPNDALALYRNGLNANDSALLYSTMPYSFNTRDTYALELRAAVNAPSGVERTSSVRDEVTIIAPQQELLTLWSRQEDWDEVRRLSCGSPWWMSGPRSTTRWEYKGAVPPSYVWAHMGTAQDQPYLPGVTDTTAFANEAAPPVPEHVFPSREDDGFVQLWPARVLEDNTTRKDRVIHFDHETRDPEGRYLPDEIVQRTAYEQQVAWTAAAMSNTDGALLRPLSFSAWVKPRALTNATLLDVAGTDPSADRLSLVIDGTDLVLRVLDGVGDHPDPLSSDEVAEVRYETTQGTSPGLPIDRWSHVEIDVRGTRPDQMSMLVNGLAHGVRTPGLTRLTANVMQGAGALPVESTEGFPQFCTVRVGNELIEVEAQPPDTRGQGVLVAAHQTTGKRAGFGGRTAREEFTTTPYTDPPPAGLAPSVPANLNAVPPLDMDHLAGTTVELYGYSLPIATNVTSGEAEIANVLAPFRVAVLDRAIGGAQAEGDPIASGAANPLYGTLGFGLEGEDSSVTALELLSADNPAAQDFMEAFNKDGGYAALVQVEWELDNGAVATPDGTPFGGVEVFRYSGWNGNTLQIAADPQGISQRGDNVPELPDIPSTANSTAGELDIGGRRAFISDWDPNWKIGNVPVSSFLDWRAYVVPISLSVPNATDFPIPNANQPISQFAQITEVDNAENTEWVRYDTFETQRAPAQLVRDDLIALGRLYWALTLRDPNLPPPVVAPPTPTGPGGPGGGGGPVEHMLASGGVSAALLATVAAPATAPVQSYSADWSPVLGTNENVDYPISSAAASQFQFRGVFGTYSHQHDPGTTILPVFATYGEEVYGADRGRPGRMDFAFLVDPSVQSLGFAVRVHRAHIPSTLIDVSTWDPAGGVPQAGQPAQVVQDGIAPNLVYVALDKRAPSPMLASPPLVGGLPVVDTRSLARLTCFPSGERPRVVETVVIGGGFQGPNSGAVPSALVDEVIFDNAEFGVKPPTGKYDDLQGACMILTRDLSDAGKSLEVNPVTVRVPGILYPLATAHFFLNDLPADGGLLRIGDEILAFNSRDAATGTMGIATNGRGLLGTTAQPHDISEPVSWLESHPVTFLTADASDGAAAFQVADLRDFPPEGTILIGSELIHYTRLSGNSLEMPRASTVAGAMDEKGDGLFRGRFGTVRAGHTAGEAVILFPFRYWDRWAPKADAPELAYFGMSVDQPAGLLSSCFFFKTDGEASQVGVLQRTDPDAPWDADPETDQRLKLYWKGDNEGQPLLVNQQSDHVDWRIFVQYSPNAFDLATGMSHGWKESPRLQRFGAFHFAPNLVLRSVER